LLRRLLGHTGTALALVGALTPSSVSENLRFPEFGERAASDSPADPLPWQGAEIVANPDAKADTSGWHAASAAGRITLGRAAGVPGPTAAPATTVTLVRAGGEGKWAFATAALRSPEQAFRVGGVYRMQAWVRDLGATGRSVGLLLADANFQHRPTMTATYAALTDSRWRLLSQTFLATGSGAAGTRLYFGLPATGALSVQITGASVRELGAPAPARGPSVPTRVVGFDGPVGTPPNPAEWGHETGGHGWGNEEVQTYTAAPGNAQLDGQGRLNITARRETATGTDRIKRDFTSARISTRGKVAVPAGSYVEASIVAPTGKGLWPAFWLMGTSFDKVGWPACGELDVLEGWGAEPTVARTAIHLPSLVNAAIDKPYGWGDAGGSTDIGQRLDAAAHRYGVYFDGKLVRFYIDRKPTMTVWSSDALLSGRAWPFAGPQYLILNVAVASSVAPDQVQFPKTMSVGPISIWSGGVPF